MQLDTTLMQSKTVIALIEFINSQNDIILAMRAEVDEIDEGVEVLVQNSIRRTELINAKQISALDMMNDNRRGPNRRSNGRIKF
jgi:hypothetical protein